MTTLTTQLRTKATIKLNGKMMTREQAITEWESKKDTCDMWVNNDTTAIKFDDDNYNYNNVFLDYTTFAAEYELRTKPAQCGEVT